MDNRLRFTFIKLIRIAGKCLFVMGLVLSIAMLFFGFWPSIIYILFMLSGAGIVSVTNTEEIDPPVKSGERFKAIISSVKVSINKIDGKLIQDSAKTALLTLLVVFGLLLAILLFGQNYFNKRDTVNDFTEIRTALDLYKESEKNYPDNLNIIISNDPTRSGWARDHWGNPYQYIPGDNKTTFTLTSAGKDGKFNTDDDIVCKN